MNHQRQHPDKCIEPNKRVCCFLRRGPLALLLAASLTIAPVKQVHGITPAQQQEIHQASSEIASMMQTILQSYMGEISVQQLYEAAMAGMASALDQHSNHIPTAQAQQLFMDYAGFIHGFGMSLIINNDGRAEVSRVMPNSPAQDAGLVLGDVLVSVDGVELSRDTFLEVFGRLSSPAFSSGSFEVESASGRRGVAMAKALIPQSTVLAKLANELLPGAAPNIGYILIESFGMNTDLEMAAAIRELQRRGATRLVLDMRHNPGGDIDVVTNIAQMIVPAGVIFSMVDNAGRASVAHSRLARTPFSEYVVLLNAQSASAAELLALALRDSGAAQVVGQQSFGKGSVQALLQLPRGDLFTLTVAEYFGRNGTPVSDIGVIPDVETHTPRFVPSGTRVAPGHNSREMPNVKSILARLGYPTGPQDINFDMQTHSSILYIQYRYGLEPSGNIDADTAMILNLLLASSLSRSDDALQQAIDILGS